MRPTPSKRALFVTAFALAVGLGGCASGGGGGGDRPEGATANRIVAAELVDLSQLDALQAIQRLRPRWLQARAGASEAPVLYVDGARRGSADELRFIRSDTVERLEYMSPSDATTRYGTGHQAGAILVTSRR